MIETAENKRVTYGFGKFVLDPQERVLTSEGNAIHLTDKVFETLLLLIRHKGRLLTKDEMMASIWTESFVEESNLAKNISRLRKILNTDSSQMIETLPRRGYRFIADVKELNNKSDLPDELRQPEALPQTHKNGHNLNERHYPVLPDAQIKTPRSTTTWIIGGFVVLVFTGIFFAYNFPVSDKLLVKNGGLTNLTNNLGEDIMPSWSPDGSKIAFSSNRNGAGDIFVMNADGTGVSRLTDTPDVETSPVWSPDGTKIIFESDRDGNEELYSMNPDGSNQTRLTFNPSRDSGPVSFSPDGKRIAFSRNAANDGRAMYNYDIYTMNIDGTDVRQLTTDAEFDAEPIWSPDGGRILFISGRDDSFEIYAINSDGSEEINLTKSSANEGAIAFTSDGTQIFCIGNTHDKIEFNQVYLINADGTNRRQITSFADKINKVVYSPQAGKFAVTSKKEGNFEIYAMGAANIPLN